jgi:hypothetical protein
MEELKQSNRHHLPARATRSMLRSAHRLFRTDSARPPATTFAHPDSPPDVEMTRALDELYPKPSSDRATIDPALYERYVWFGLHQ